MTNLRKDSLIIGTKKEVLLPWDIPNMTDVPAKIATTILKRMEAKEP